MKRPLAHRARPETFDDIVGQSHLVGADGVLRKMAEQSAHASVILYGPPGTGKTTIASVMADQFGLSAFTFNASTDTKAALKQIVEQATGYGALVVVDEIHRMKKDVQDYLLPHVEKGDVIMVGITTNNPYHSVNPAIRSRAHVFKLNPITEEALVSHLKRIKARFSEELTATIDDSVYAYIAKASHNDIRAAINRLELIESTHQGVRVGLEEAKKVLLAPTLDLDKDEDNYFNILSAYQKSIRGSDVDASLHYLARLLAMEDLDSILRRLSVIAYEDIGLANPSVFAKMHACAAAVERLGLPEARIPLAALTIDLALSPKSNSAVKAIDKALADVEAGKTPKIPNHLINVANFEDKDDYLYPHDYPDHHVVQQYLPDALKDAIYYEGVDTGKYEAALKGRHTAIRKTNHDKK